MAFNFSSLFVYKIIAIKWQNIRSYIRGNKKGCFCHCKKKKKNRIKISSYFLNFELLSQMLVSKLFDLKKLLRFFIFIFW